MGKHRQSIFKMSDAKNAEETITEFLGHAKELAQRHFKNRDKDCLCFFVVSEEGELNCLGYGLPGPELIKTAAKAIEEEDSETKH